MTTRFTSTPGVPTAAAVPQTLQTAPATYNRWQRSISGLVVTAILALALEPLTVFAKEQPQLNPVSQAQVQRLQQWGNKLDAGRQHQAIAQQEAQRSSAQQLHAELAATHELLRELQRDSDAKGVLAEAISPTKTKPPTARTLAVGPDKRVSQTPSAEQINQRAAQLKQLSPRDRQQKLAQLKQHLQRSTQRSVASALVDYDRTRQHLIDRKLPAEILARHDAAVAQIQANIERYQQLALRTLDNLQAGQTDSKALAGLVQYFQDVPAAPSHQATDPNKLPWSKPEPIKRAPATNNRELKLAIHGQRLPTLAALGMPQGVTLAQLAPEPPSLPTVDDLGTSDEIVLTPAIIAKAAALGNNPVQIYNWVRNTIRWIPSAGAMQNADYTLQAQFGNATDIAGLTIALLRAANIPARYVFGTIDVDADKVDNWVGGATNNDATLSLLAQGGIPNIGLTQGGKTKWVRMEHVWVEAYIDNTPSRGNKHGNPNNPASAKEWLPLDASYKQYDYKAGLDIQSQVPVDSQALLTAIQQGATINSTQGWVQNLNQTALQSQLTAYQAKVKQYIDTTKPNATVGDVLGTRAPIVQNYSYLLGTLPYQQTKDSSGKPVQTRLSKLTDAQRWQWQLQVGQDTSITLFGVTIPGGFSPFMTYTQNAANLNGKSITLSYTPATQADLDVINSYLPQPHADGSPIQPSELPTSLPAYLIKLHAEIRVDGQVVLSSASSSPNGIQMGQKLRMDGALYNPNKSDWGGQASMNTFAGEYNALYVDWQGISPHQLQAHQAKLQATKEKLAQFILQKNNLNLLKSIINDDLPGLVHTSSVLTWFVNDDLNSQNQARFKGDMLRYRLPSYGRFYTFMKPGGMFGNNGSGNFTGVMMDIAFSTENVKAKDNSHDKYIEYQRQTGAVASAYEHSVPEQLFREPNKPATDPSQPQGISAAKALAIAAAQGQKIITLNANNSAYHSSLLAGAQYSSDTKAEMADALANGKEVTLHEQRITVSFTDSNGITKVGSPTAGYVIFDPESGSSAWMIESGKNGGVSENTQNMVHATLGTFFLGGLLALGALGLGFAWVLAASVLCFAAIKYLELISKVIDENNLSQCQKEKVISAISMMAAISNLFAGAKVADYGAKLLAGFIGFIAALQKYAIDLLTGVFPAQEC